MQIKRLQNGDAGEDVEVNFVDLPLAQGKCLRSGCPAKEIQSHTHLVDSWRRVLTLLGGACPLRPLVGSCALQAKLIWPGIDFACPAGGKISNLCKIGA